MGLYLLNKTAGVPFNNFVCATLKFLRFSNFYIDFNYLFTMYCFIYAKIAFWELLF